MMIWEETSILIQSRWPLRILEAFIGLFAANQSANAVTQCEPSSAQKPRELFPSHSQYGISVLLKASEKKCWLGTHSLPWKQRKITLWLWFKAEKPTLCEREWTEEWNEWKREMGPCGRQSDLQTRLKNLLTFTYSGLMRLKRQAVARPRTFMTSYRAGSRLPKGSAFSCGGPRTHHKMQRLQLAQGFFFL